MTMIDYSSLPKLPSGWKYQNLEDLVDERGICYGVVQPGQHSDIGIPLVRVNNLKNHQIVTSDIMKITPEIESKYKRSRLLGGEVLLSLVGTLGQVAVVPPELAGWNTARAVGVIPVRKDIDPRWIAICLRAGLSQNYMLMRANTTVQATLNLKDVNQIPIPMPPVRLISALANKASLLDQKIDLNNIINQNLEFIAKSIFKEWFIDFGPVKAKAEGRRPFGISDEVAALFSDSFEETEFGKFPKGWSISRITDISEILNGFAFKSEDYKDSGIFVLRTKNFSDQGYATKLTDDVFLSEEMAKEYESYLIRPFDIHLVMVAASIGKTSITPPCLLPALRNQNMWCFRNKSNFPFRHFLNLLVPFVTEKLKGFSSGSARDFFRKGDFQNYKIVLPPTTILETCESLLKPLFDQIVTNIQENIYLEETRNLLLPKLISGEIELKDLNV